MKKKCLNWLSTRVYILMRYLGIKIRIDSKQVRRSMDSFFYSEEWKYQTTITKIEVYQHRNHLEVLIETHRPGILIGKGGSFIDSLRKRLEEDLNNEIEFNLKESKLWHSLYR